MNHGTVRRSHYQLLDCMTVLNPGSFGPAVLVRQQAVYIVPITTLSTGRANLVVIASRRRIPLIRGNVFTIRNGNLMIVQAANRANTHHQRRVRLVARVNGTGVTTDLLRVRSLLLGTHGRRHPANPHRGIVFRNVKRNNRKNLRVRSKSGLKGYN